MSDMLVVLAVIFTATVLGYVGWRMTAGRLLNPDRWVPPAGFYGDEPANDHTIGDN